MGSQEDAPVQPWIETPCLYSAALSQTAGCHIYLKLECLQPSGSFKSRGIGHLMVRAMARAGSGAAVHFYCSSGGNAGLACAAAARALGAPATIVVPTLVSPYMVGKLQAAGAAVLQTGVSWAEADAHLRSTLLQKEGAVYVPPFDHPDVWAGAATLVEELPGQLPAGLRPDALVCSVGGGGLLVGLLQGLEAVYGDHPTARVLAVETEGADSLAASVQAGRLVRLPAITSVATSLGATQVAEAAFAWWTRRPDQVVSAVVSDATAVDAIVRFLDDTRLLVEPACGAALAPVYSSLLRQRLGTGLSDAAWAEQNIVIVVCGGSNINLDMLADYRARFGV